MNTSALNARTLQAEFDWLSDVLKVRFEHYFNSERNDTSIYDLSMPDLSEDESTYAQIIRHYDFQAPERIIILLAMAPHVYPSLLDIFFTRNALYDRGYTEFGGLKGHTHSGFVPTGETAVFILAGGDLEQRFMVNDLLGPHNPLIKYKIVQLESLRTSEPRLSGALSISEEYLTYFTSGASYKPDFNSKFPAKLISTRLDWSDLVLEEFVLEEVQEIQTWLEHSDTILYEWGLRDKLKPGYRALFHGPPGTGKTLTATLIGKSLDLDVYRIDLSQVVSKYIGETEKNMANIFDQAENKNWILFFDEADALFGKRTVTTDSKDRHANQEVAYLLQRIEDFPGVVILATNLKTNIDQAFTRRFQAIIYFPIPNPEQRMKIWEKAFSGKVKLEPGIDFERIAYDYPITGGGVINVLRYCSISALRNGSGVISYSDIIRGISKEYEKEGKTL